jgi:hypothetical protein
MIDQGVEGGEGGQREEGMGSSLSEKSIQSQNADSFWISKSTRPPSRVLGNTLEPVSRA